MSDLEIDLFGVADIRLNGEQVHLRRRHSLALLSYLVLSGRPQARGDVAALLAGDLDVEPARKLLRNALGDLNGHGLGAYIVASRNALSFHTEVPAQVVDVYRLDAVHAQGVSASTDDLLWASNFFGVELLSGLSTSDGPGFEEWLLQERELRGRQVEELSLRLLQRYETGEYLDEGIRLARRLISIDPWNEDMHRRLMRLLARDNQISEAIEQFNRCRAILQEELGALPQPESVALYERLMAGPRPIRHNMNPVTVADTGWLIGRDAEVTSITRNLMQPDCRLVSVTGLPGSGRSSVARAAAVRLARPQMFPDEYRFIDGVFLVDLATPVSALPGDTAQGTEDQRLAYDIGVGLGLAFYGNVDPLEHVLSYLLTKRILIVLDNYERSGCEATVLEAILRQAPHVSVMLTSREPLGIAGEWTRRVRGLDVPQDPAEIQFAPASKVLLQEAERLNAPIRTGDAPYIVQLCQLVGGHPAALKLLAAWLRVLPGSEIVWQLSNGGPLLSESVMVQNDHRVSLQDIAESEWFSFTDDERQSLMRLAVFFGKIDFDAVLAVGVSLDQVQHLADLAYIEYMDGGYALHPLVGVFGLHRLREVPDLETEVRNLHAKYFSGFIARRAAHLNQDQDAFDEVQGVIKNLFAAWEWAVQLRDTACLADMLPGMTTWSELAGRHAEWADVLSESSTRLAESLQTTPDREVHRVVCSLLLAEADAVHWQGEYSRAIRAMMEARHHADATDDPVLLARVSLRQARVLHYQGIEADVLSLLLGAASFAVDAEDRSLEAFCMMVLSAAYIDYGQFQKAHEALDRAERTFQVLGEPGSISRVFLDRGRSWTVSGDFTRAQVSLQQAVHTSRRFHDKPDEAWSTAYLARVLGDGFGDHGAAQLHIERAHELADEISERMFVSYLYWIDGRNAMHIGDLGRARQQLDVALEMGRDLTNTVTISRVLSALAQCALMAGDADPAQSLVDQAIQIARDARRRPTMAAALVVCGQAYAALDMLENAQISYTRAHAIASVLGMPHISCDANAGLASVALARGDSAAAMEPAEQIIGYLESQSLNGCEDPAGVALVGYRALLAANDSRALPVLQSSYRLLQQRARTLPEDQRGRYLEATAERRELCALVDGISVAYP